MGNERWWGENGRVREREMFLMKGFGEARGERGRERRAEREGGRDGWFDVFNARFWRGEGGEGGSGGEIERGAVMFLIQGFWKGEDRRGDRERWL